MKFLCSLVKTDLGIFSLIFTVIMLVTVIHVMRQPRWYEASGAVKYLSRSTPTPGSRDSGSSMEDGNKMRKARSRLRVA